MNETRDPLLLDHDYDGIQELDNQLPRWWVWLFYGTILFSALYLTHYHVLGKGKLMIAEYEEEMRIGEQIKQAAMARFEQEMETLKPSQDPAILAQGRELFAKLCAPCHRADGGGLVGPNLCDDYWIHGAEFRDNLRTIYHGVPEKGMVAWKTVLKPREIHAVGSYIYTLRGSNPPNPKPREDQAPQPTGPSIYE
ncbi:cbb3-type cytochrome c oxidase N-terminal domain-containing protein [Limisphaera sp. VF-2]|jgi:cytochrome c oxidase cbb3-type subunit 3|uniref:cbb3-type cytochrome c oxidase N-terminal domain-containing protein n=1 Tax=Limisphaera sp. VF-2 TaxID=3400418 RepID=UPI00177A4C12